MKFFFTIALLFTHIVMADPAPTAAPTPATGSSSQAEPKAIVAPVAPTLTPAAQPLPLPTEVLPPHAILLTVWTRDKKADYDSKVAPFLKMELQGCAECVVRNISRYDDKGNFKSDVAKGDLDSMVAQSSVILVNFNERPSAANKDMVSSLKQAREKGVLVVFAAGEPSSKTESSAPLSQTIAGLVPNALIIGELGEKDRLLGFSYFGPEMLTAIRPPKDHIGEGLAPALFAAKLTKNFHKKADWIHFLNERKQSSRKIWLDLNDCFQH